MKQKRGCISLKAVQARVVNEGKACLWQRELVGIPVRAFICHPSRGVLTRHHTRVCTNVSGESQSLLFPQVWNPRGKQNGVSGFVCLQCTRAHVQTRAPAPGLSGTMSLSPSPMLPTAVARRRLLMHGWPSMLQCLSMRQHRDLLNLHKEAHKTVIFTKGMDIPNKIAKMMRLTSWWLYRSHTWRSGWWSPTWNTKHGLWLRDVAENLIGRKELNSYHMTFSS